MRARLAAGNGFMSWRAGVAISRAVTMVAVLAVHAAPSALALVPGQPMPAIQADASLLHRVADSGIDIVRMPQRPAPATHPPAKSAAQQPPVVPPPALPPPAAPPAIPPPSQTPTPQPQGRLVKVTVKIGSQAKDPPKGWLGVQMDTLELPLALSLGLANANGALILEAAANSPAGQAGLRFGDIAVGLNGRPVALASELTQRVSSMTPGTDAELEVWRVTADGGDFLQTLRRLAEGGNAHVMFRLGRMYATGVGVARDDAEAVSWYRKGASAGNLNAMSALGVALMEGRGVGKDPQEGLRLLRAAADKDNMDAVYRLGVALADGKVVAKDTAEAMRLFTKAAEAGHVPSMVDLALLYNAADSATADPFKAALWYKRAADLGSSAGMVNLGFMHQLGKGVEKNDITAVALYRRAAAEGNPSGIHNLAAMLDSGRGVARKDPEQAADLILQALEMRNDFSFRQMSQNSRAWSPEFRRELQKKLRDAGVYSGRIDGELRDTTITAITAYMNRKR
jgi:TPR repeat protein